MALPVPMRGPFLSGDSVWENCCAMGAGLKTDIRILIFPFIAKNYQEGFNTLPSLIIPTILWGSINSMWSMRELSYIKIKQSAPSHSGRKWGNRMCGLAVMTANPCLGPPAVLLPAPCVPGREPLCTCSTGHRFQCTPMSPRLSLFRQQVGRSVSWNWLFWDGLECTTCFPWKSCHQETGLAALFTHFLPNSLLQSWLSALLG